MHDQVRLRMGGGEDSLVPIQEGVYFKSVALGRRLGGPVEAEVVARSIDLSAMLHEFGQYCKIAASVDSGTIVF